MSLVIRSVWSVPVSLPLSSVSVPGNGFTVSILTPDTVPVTAELPAMSVTVARTEYVPLASVSAVMLVNVAVAKLPVSVQVVPFVLTCSCTDARPANASLAPARVKVGVVTLVNWSLASVPVSLPL